MLCFVKGEPEGRDAKRWLDHASELGLACGREIHGDDDTGWFQVMSSVRTAAAAVWLATGGHPSWSKLDASSLSAFVDRQGSGEEMLQLVAFDAYAFFTFMRRHGLVSSATAYRVQEKLWPLAAPVFERGLEECADEADSTTAAAMLGATFATTQPVGLA